MGDKYRNSDGRLVPLDTLCRQEPAWAANRIRAALGTRIAELETALRELVGAVPSCHYCGDPATSEHVDLFDVHECYGCDECTVRHVAITVIELDHAPALRKAQVALEAGGG